MLARQALRVPLFRFSRVLSTECKKSNFPGAQSLFTTSLELSNVEIAPMDCFRRMDESATFLDPSYKISVNLPIMSQCFLDFRRHPYPNVFNNGEIECDGPNFL